MNRGGFSWKRLLGISAFKSRISRYTGIPLTKSGRQQKIGRMVSGGCMVSVVLFLAIPAAIVFLAYKLA